MLKFNLKHLVLLLSIALAIVSCKQHDEVRPKKGTPGEKVITLTPQESKAIEKLGKLYQDKDMIALKDKLMSSIPTSLKKDLRNTDLLDVTLSKIQIAFAEKLLNEGLMQEVQPIVNAINTKYPGRFTGFNESGIRESLKQNRAKLKQARLSLSECNRITGQRIDQIRSNYYNTVMRHMSIVAGKYDGKSHNQRRLFEMALYRHSIDARSRMGYFIGARATGCEGLQLVPDPPVLIIFTAFFAAAESSLQDIADGFGAPAHFTNIGNIYNARFQIRSLPNKFLRPSVLTRKNFQAVVDSDVRTLNIIWINGGNGKVLIEDDRTKRVLNGAANPARFLNGRGGDSQYYIEPGSDRAGYTFRLRSVQRNKHLKFSLANDGFFSLGNGRGQEHDFFLK